MKKLKSIPKHSIHFLPILCVRVTGAVVWAGTLRLRSPWTRPPALSIDIVMPTSHRSSLGSLPSWTCQETTSRGKRWWGMRDTAQATSALVLLEVEKQQVYSKLLTGAKSLHPISKGEETCFSHLYPPSCSFTHDPMFIYFCLWSWPKVHNHSSNKCRLTHYLESFFYIFTTTN